MARPTPLQLSRDDLIDFVIRKTELAKVEFVPATEHVGIGSTFAAAIITFLLHSLWTLIIALALALSWLMSFTGFSIVGRLALGFLAAVLLSIGIAVLLIFIAHDRFQKAKVPTATIEGARATFVTLTDTVIG